MDLCRGICRRDVSINRRWTKAHVSVRIFRGDLDLRRNCVSKINDCLWGIVRHAFWTVGRGDEGDEASCSHQDATLPRVLGKDTTVFQ